jgi:hypothetical protein
VFKRVFQIIFFFSVEMKNARCSRIAPTAAGIKRPADRIILQDFYLPEAY